MTTKSMKEKDSRVSTSARVGTVYHGESDELFASLRPLLIMGKILGILPLNGVYHKKSHMLTFSWKSGVTIMNVVLCTLLCFCTVINLMVAIEVDSLTTSDLAWSAHLAVYYGIGTFIYWFCLKNSHLLIQILRRWRELSLHFNGEDKHVRRDIKLIAGCIFTSCILEHSYAHLKFFPIVENAERRLLNRKALLERLQNSSALEVYYWRSHPFVGDYIPYNPGVAILLFLCSKFCILAWNFGDVLVACTARALYGKLAAFCCKAKAHLLSENILGNEINGSGFLYFIQMPLIIPSQGLYGNEWIHFVSDQDSLTEMVEEVDCFLSPMIFTLYGVNIYYFCIQLNLGLTPSANSTTIASIYAVWSFLHLIARILVVSISVSNIHAQYQSVAKILRKCPQKYYSPEVERAERIVRTTNIGLTGLGCFVVTRHFILQIINVVFTFEIVLLQTSGMPLANSSINVY